MEFRIGTSGYSYKDWEGVFYPDATPAGQRLNYYATQFDTVEVNSSYYRIPHSAVFYHMAQKTPENFEFIVKVNKETTHVRKENAEAMHKLLESVRPLIEAGKLKGLLAQFPYSFKNSPATRDYLRQTRELCGDIPLFVEFRNWTWDSQELGGFLKMHDIGYVNVDEPRLRGLLPPQELNTAAISYVRFHGRNQTAWWNGTNETRYFYEYKRPELDEWLLRLARLIKRSVRTYIFFNNHPQGNAVKNAQELKQMLVSQLASGSD